MSQTVNVPSCENNLGRAVQNFMYVESNKPQQLSKRLYQSKMNNSFKETDVSLSQDISEYVNTQTDFTLKNIKVFHSSHLLAHCLRIAKFKDYANGLTIAVLEFTDRPPLFHFAICSKQDAFSRLEGRVYAKRKLLAVMKTEGVTGLYELPTPIEHLTTTVNAFKIGNYIVKNFILPEKEKAPIYVNMLKYENEDNLLAMAQELLSQKYDIDKTTFRLHTQYIRFYRNKLFSHGLVCTPDWFNSLKQEGKQLVSNGGYTIYAMIGMNKDTKANEVLVTMSRCSPEEAYVKSYGRKQCLINFIKDNVQVYSLSKPLDNINEALISLAEKALEHAINVEIISEKESLALKQH